MKVFIRVFRALQRSKNKTATAEINDTKTTSDSVSAPPVNMVTLKSSPKVCFNMLDKDLETKAPSVPRKKLQVVESFMAIAAKHDDKALLATFKSPSARIHLEDGFSMDAQTFCDTLRIMWDAFPDHKFCYETLEVVGETVELDNLVSSATHTGAPYTIGPKFPAIPAAGKYVINDQERLVFTFTEDGERLEDMSVISFGNVTGPAGFYEQIGGKL